MPLIGWPFGCVFVVHLNSVDHAFSPFWGEHVKINVFFLVIMCWGLNFHYFMGIKL